MFKDKDTKRLYEMIAKSKEIQELIKKIVETNVSDGFSDKTNGSVEEDTLFGSAEKDDLFKKYKKFYFDSVDKINRYDEIEEENKKLKEDYKTKQGAYVALDSKYKDLTKKNEEQSQQNANNLKKIEGLERKILDKQQELDSANTIISNFETPIELFKKYKEVSERVKHGLENVINYENEILFIVSCTSEQNLSSIWRYIRDISSDEAGNDFVILNEIFDYFFEVFNNSLPESRYIRDDVKVGDEFDSDYHDRCYGSLTSGDVTRVVLRGYRSKNTGKIIHKSLVGV